MTKKKIRWSVGVIGVIVVIVTITLYFVFKQSFEELIEETIELLEKEIVKSRFSDPQLLIDTQQHLREILEDYRQEEEPGVKAALRETALLLRAETLKLLKLERDFQQVHKELEEALAILKEINRRLEEQLKEMK